MLTWVIVKARIDSSLNLYEHCVACDNENNCCPAGPSLRGQPYGAILRGRLPCLSCIRLALYTAIRGVRTPRKAVYSQLLSPKMASGSAHGAFVLHKCATKAKQAFLAYFGGILAVPGAGSSCFHCRRPRSARINLVNCQSQSPKSTFIVIP